MVLAPAASHRRGVYERLKKEKKRKKAGEGDALVPASTPVANGSILFVGRFDGQG